MVPEGGAAVGGARTRHRSPVRIKLERNKAVLSWNEALDALSSSGAACDDRHLLGHLWSATRCGENTTRDRPSLKQPAQFVRMLQPRILITHCCLSHLVPPLLPHKLGKGAL